MKFRKTYYYDRTDYNYIDRCGRKVTINVGDKSAIDGDEVTADMIKLLHAMDDAEVYNNLKNCRPPITKEEKEQIRQWEKDHPGDKCQRRWNISLDMYAGDDDSDIDRSPIMKEAYERMRHETQLAERITDIIDEMPEKTRLVATYVWIDGWKEKDVAEELGCTKANVSKLLCRAKQILKEKF